jgi:hypothetical protein
MRGDLEAYLDNLENILMGLEKQPDPDLLHAFVVPQLRKCKELAPDFVTYDRADDGSVERSVETMLDAARRLVARKRRASTEAEMIGTRVQVSVDQDEEGKDSTKNVCYDYQKGKCKFGDNCRFLHEEQRTSIKDGGKGRKGKIDGKGKTRRMFTKEEREKMAKEECQEYKEGRCNFGERCFRIHEEGDDPMERVPSWY